MSRRSWLFKGVAGAAIVCGLGAAGYIHAQMKDATTGVAPVDDPSKPRGVFNFECNLGSFKLLNGLGRVEFSFSGTAMVNDVKGQVIPSGDLRLEYDEHNRKVYFGTGKLIVEGPFRSVQWFGQNMKGRWEGAGNARLFGEFDTTGNTGTYWYGDEGQRLPWYTSGLDLPVPDPRTSGPVPVPRTSGE